MTPQNQEELERILRHLAEGIEAVVQRGVADGLLKPEERPYRRHEGKGFEYNEKGARFGSQSWKSFTKDTWDTAYANLVLTAQESTDYTRSVEALNRCSKAGKAVSNRLSRIVQQLVWTS